MTTMTQRRAFKTERPLKAPWWLWSAGLLTFFTGHAAATPPPEPCPETAPAGFEAAYPDLWIGHGSWLMLAASLALLVYSAVHAFRSLEAPRQTQPLLGLAAGSLLGVGAVAGSVFFSLMLAVMTFFRNNCLFCAVDRPQVALAGEFLIIAVVLGSLAAVTFLLHKTMSTRPVLRNVLISLLIPPGFVTWMALVLFSNSTYINTYCQEAPRQDLYAPAPVEAPP